MCCREEFLFFEDLEISNGCIGFGKGRSFNEELKIFFGEG